LFQSYFLLFALISILESSKSSANVKPLSNGSVNCYVWFVVYAFVEIVMFGGSGIMSVM